MTTQVVVKKKSHILKRRCPGLIKSKVLFPNFHIVLPNATKYMNWLKRQDCNRLQNRRIFCEHARSSNERSGDNVKTENETNKTTDLHSGITGWIVDYSSSNLILCQDVKKSKSPF